MSRRDECASLLNAKKMDFSVVLLLLLRFAVWLGLLLLLLLAFQQLLDNCYMHATCRGSLVFELAVCC